jgi:hypothetical protein
LFPSCMVGQEQARSKSLASVPVAAARCILITSGPDAFQKKNSFLQLQIFLSFDVPTAQLDALDFLWFLRPRAMAAAPPSPRCCACTGVLHKSVAWETLADVPHIQGLALPQPADNCERFRRYCDFLAIFDQVPSPFIHGSRSVSVLQARHDQLLQ